MIKTLFLLLALCHLSFAHKLNVFTDFQNGNLYLSSYFANGTACKNCKVIIKNGKTVILETKTNIKGEVEVSLKKKSFDILVDAGSSHIVKKSILNEDEKLDDKNVKIKDNEYKKLLDENKKLKIEVKMLEDKLEQMGIYKTLFALLIIFGIFAFLKRVKK